MRSGLGIKDLEESWQRGQAKLQNLRLSSSPNHVNRRYDAKMLNSIYGLTGENINSKVAIGDELGCSTAHVKTFQGECVLPQTQCCSDAVEIQSDDEVG